MTKLAQIPALAAVLTSYATAGADIQARNLELPAQVRIELADGRRIECTVVKWDGFVLEGSCGALAWTSLKRNTALAAFKQLVSERDTEACADALAVVLSLDESGIAERPALDWAKGAGADAARLDRARRDAAALKLARAARDRADRVARLERLTPEAGTFRPGPWKDLSPTEVPLAGAASIEAARALLAKAGGSATLHEADNVALLCEREREASLADTTFLQRFYRVWRDRLESASIHVAEQGVIPIIMVGDSDRWRLLIQVAFGGDAAEHPDAVVIYPSTGTPPEMRPIVLVRPDSDATRQRANACVGLARAMLHLAGSPERAPTWLNEALPRVMADSFAPEARRDAEYRPAALAAVRTGFGFGPVLTGTYGEGVWAGDPARARAVSYLFARWLADQAAQPLLRYAESPRTSEGEPARFKRIFGMTLEEAAARATRWFQTND